MSDNQKKWTVMVFMGAATIDGEENLLDAAEKDLIEMASVGSGLVEKEDDLREMASVGSGQMEGVDGDELNIFVQVYARHGPDEVLSARYGKIEEGMFNRFNQMQKRPVGDLFESFGEEVYKEGSDGNEIGSIGPEAVKEFVSKAIAEAGHKPANPHHYSMLVLWGHAYDFAIGRAARRDGTIDALDFKELSEALKELQEEYSQFIVDDKQPDVKLDILGFDACGLSTVETASQLEPFATYLLASEIGIPIPGWPYDRILERLRKPYGRLMNPLEFGSWAVRRFCEFHGAKDVTVSLTLLNLQRVIELRAHTECLAITLASVIGNPDARDRIANLIAQSQTDVGEPFVDLGDVCFNLVRSGGDARVIEAARALGDLLISPPPEIAGKRSGEEEDQKDLPFIVEHGRNSAQTARLNGISFYAPHVAPNRDFNRVQELYLNFKFATTQWSGLMHSLARLS